MVERWDQGLGIMRAFVALCSAQFLIELVPFRCWRDSLGGALPTLAQRASIVRLAEAEDLAKQVEWVADTLPFGLKCLPRAMALSSILRRKGFPHVIVFAARPAEMRKSHDALHSWIEIDGMKIIGESPGPWLETLRLGKG
jgi:hypothetical protein